MIMVNIFRLVFPITLYIHLLVFVIICLSMSIFLCQRCQL